MKDNILTDVAWIKTTDGQKTIEDVLKNWKNLQLATDVPGYIYGAQFRFLMQLYVMLVYKANGRPQAISTSHIDELLNELEPYAHLLDENEPFLQVPDRLITNKDAVLMKTQKEPLNPIILSPTDYSQSFWTMQESPFGEFGAAEATLLLVSAYFYKSRLNSKFDNIQPNNSASASRYISGPENGFPTEMIPLGESLFITLGLATPRELTHGKPSIHWTDREGLGFKNEKPNRLWLSSWNSNSIYCEWLVDENNDITLNSAQFGGGTFKWAPAPLFDQKSDKNWKVTFDERNQSDPLYFYSEGDIKDRKLRLLNLGTQSHYFIALWLDKDYSNQLNAKWSGNIAFNEANLETILFLEHYVGGTAQVFYIRHSKIIQGYKEELLPSNKATKLIKLYSKVLPIQNQLDLMLKEKREGNTNKGLLWKVFPLKKEIINHFWNDIGEIVDIAIDSPDDYDFNSEVIKMAIKAIHYAIPPTDTIKAEERFLAEKSLKGFYKNGK